LALTRSRISHHRFRIEMKDLAVILKEAQNLVVKNLNQTLTESFTSDLVPSQKTMALKEQKCHKRRPWKKPKNKPKRPLSAYNLFFQHQRSVILASIPGDYSLSNDALSEEQRRKKHRKMHGKIGFAALAKVIAEKWKHCDNMTRRSFEIQAGWDKQRYRSEIEEWRNKIEEIDGCDSSSTLKKPCDKIHAKPESAISLDFNHFSQSNQLNHDLTSPKYSTTDSLQDIYNTPSRGHNAIMAECASNLLRQSPVFQNHLGVLTRHLRNPQPSESADRLSCMEDPYCTTILEASPDESFSKDTFFEERIEDEALALDIFINYEEPISIDDFKRYYHDISYLSIEK
jgi:hypothetical protein